MYARRCTRALRGGVSRGRRAGLVLVALGAATMACSTATGQGVPADVGQWNDPLNTGSSWGPDHSVSAMHAAHLPTGSILVWRTYPPAEPFLWDPVLDTLTSIPTNFTINCTGHAGLSDGTTLLAGGPNTAETKIFSLAALFGGPWHLVAYMEHDRFYPTCTTLPYGQVLATAGTDEIYTQLIPEIFDPGDDPLEGTWQEIVPMIETTGIGREYPHMFVVPDDDPDVQKVFFSSSFDPSSNDTDEITYTLDIGPPATWTAVGGVPPFSTSLVSAVMYEPGLVLKSGGNDYLYGMGALADTATINLNDVVPPPAWQSEQSMKKARQEHNLVLLPDGKILAVGGENNLGAVKEAEWFDPDQPFPTWDELAAMNRGRAHHSTAMLLADGRVLSAGGEEGLPQGTAEIFSPPYLFWGARPVIGFAPTVVQYGQDFPVVMAGLANPQIDKVNFLRLGAVTHSFDQNQRFVKLVFTQILGTLTVTAPPNGSYAPPGYYMLFLISDEGVPSVAKYVRLRHPVN